MIDDRDQNQLSRHPQNGSEFLLTSRLQIQKAAFPRLSRSQKEHTSVAESCDRPEKSLSAVFQPGGSVHADQADCQHSDQTAKTGLAVNPPCPIPQAAEKNEGGCKCGALPINAPASRIAAVFPTASRMTSIPYWMTCLSSSEFPRHRTHHPEIFTAQVCIICILQDCIITFFSCSSSFFPKRLKIRPERILFLTKFSEFLFYSLLF